MTFNEVKNIMNDYKIFKNELNNRGLIWEIHCNNQCICKCLDEDMAKDKIKLLLEVDKLKATRPDFTVITQLEDYIKKF